MGTSCNDLHPTSRFETRDQPKTIRILGREPYHLPLPSTPMPCFSLPAKGPGGGLIPVIRVATLSPKRSQRKGHCLHSTLFTLTCIYIHTHTQPQAFLSWCFLGISPDVSCHRTFIPRMDMTGPLLNLDLSIFLDDTLTNPLQKSSVLPSARQILTPPS